MSIQRPNKLKQMIFNQFLATKWKLHIFTYYSITIVRNNWNICNWRELQTNSQAKRKRRRSIWSANSLDGIVLHQIVENVRKHRARKWIELNAYELKKKERRRCIWRMWGKKRSSATLEITMNLIISNGSEMNRILISDIDRFKCEKRFAYSNFVRWYRARKRERESKKKKWCARVFAINFGWCEASNF